MGLICSKRKENESETISRVSPFGRFGRRSFQRHNRGHVDENSLLGMALEQTCKTLHLQDTDALRELPIDLAQLILSRLIETGRLNDAAVLRLQGQQFYELSLDAYPIKICDFWIRFLVTGETLETAILSRTQIDDYVLSAFPYLPRLKILRLDCCEAISDAGLSVLNRLPALQELSLQGCDLLGPLCMGSIARLSSLKRLNLNSCHKIWGLGPLRRLTQLEVLDVGWCNSITDEDAAAIASLTTLKELRLCHTAMTDEGIALFRSLTGVTSLSMGGVRVSDTTVASVVGAMPLLRVLNVERCAAVGDITLRALGETAPPLEELDVSYTDVGDDALASLFTKIPTLHRLNLDSCGIGDNALTSIHQHLPALQVLDLSDTMVANHSMRSVGRLPSLTQLDLSFTEVNDHGLQVLCMHATKLKALNLDSRSFCDTGMKFVATLPHLETLDLFGAQITDIGCGYLTTTGSHRPPLRNLEICSQLITDAGVAKLTALTGLRQLSLAQNTRVGNASLKHIATLQHLTALNLSQCRVTSNGVLSQSGGLHKLKNLKVVCLADTKVHSAAGARLMEMNKELEIVGLKID